MNMGHCGCGFLALKNRAAPGHVPGAEPARDRPGDCYMSRERWFAKAVTKTRNL